MHNRGIRKESRTGYEKKNTEEGSYKRLLNFKNQQLKRKLMLIIQTQQYYRNLHALKARPRNQPICYLTLLSRRLKFLCPTDKQKLFIEVAHRISITHLFYDSHYTTCSFKKCGASKQLNPFSSISTLSKQIASVISRTRDHYCSKTTKIAVPTCSILKHTITLQSKLS